MELYSDTKNEILSFSGEWMKLKNLSEVSQAQKPKIACSPSHADYKLKTNILILLDRSHILRGDCSLEGKGKGRKLKP
jgi:hypothetical protein